LSQQKQEVNCFFCKKKDHLKKNCTKYKLWKSNKENKEKANTISKDNEDPEICFSVNDDRVKHEGWYVDSGATSHMMSNPNFFEGLRRCNNKRLRLANGKCVEIHGVGDGNILCQDEAGKCTNVKVVMSIFHDD